jgi:hypothetical protein
MEIADLEGKEITVTDLPIALMQTDDYRYYRVSNPSEHDLYLYKYWEDIYQKLLLLEMELTSRN